MKTNRYFIKRIFSILIALVIISSTCISGFATTNSVASTPILGDANLNKVVDISDATAIQCHLAEISKLSELGEKCANVSNDEYLSIMDATMIQYYLAQLIEKFPSDTTYSIELDEIPEYNNSPYYVVNNNIPYFSYQEKSFTFSYEEYRPLDNSNRCQVVYANIGTNLMPTEDRESISSVYPSGWKYNNKSNNHLYDTALVDGGYIYNRCHLIGFQLTGENANKNNLITGTRYLNINGMLPFENLVDDYIESTDNHVLYRVTPLFEGSDMVAKGVLMEGWSLEDNGEGICFNVFCYNVQPGIEINYTTGENELIQSIPNPPNTESTTYILNTNSKKFHYTTCSSVDKINEYNKAEYTGFREDLLSQNYTPCGTCKP